MTTAPATDRQMAFIESLIAERTITPAVPDDLLTKRPLTRPEASALIGYLTEAPRKARIDFPVGDARRSIWDDLNDVLADVPVGYYALATLDPAQPHFFRVRMYRGRKYFNRIVGGHPTFRKASTSAPQLVAAATAIKDDAKAAALLFSASTDRCAHCHAELTDEVSVRLRVGPVCRKAWVDRGWIDAATIAEARALARAL